jgi:hypothetical protein
MPIFANKMTNRHFLDVRFAQEGTLAKELYAKWQFGDDRQGRLLPRERRRHVPSQV